MGSREKLADDDKFVPSVTDSVPPASSLNHSKLLGWTVSYWTKKNNKNKNEDEADKTIKHTRTMHLLLRQLRWSIHAEEKSTVKAPPFITFIFFFFFFSHQLERPISLQTASYMGRCLCLVICPPIHILNRILFNLMHGHLLFFWLSWKRGISCWLVERNFLGDSYN